MRPEVLNLVGAGLVTVAFLDELVAIEAGRIVRTPRSEALQASIVPTSLREPAPIYAAAPPYCRCLDAEGERALTQTEYQHLRSALPTYDLALDLTQTRQAGRHPAWRREASRTSPRR